jgi:hypothetical protein
MFINSVNYEISYVVITIKNQMLNKKKQANSKLLLSYFGQGTGITYFIFLEYQGIALIKQGKTMYASAIHIIPCF